MKIRIMALVALTLSVVCAHDGFAQTPQVPSEVREQRAFFDFLVGEWTIEKSQTPTGTTAGGNDRYKFRKALDSGGIFADWYFNRGSKEKPDYTNAIYISGFDNSAKTWTFYYVSEKSAQLYEGRNENGQWLFYRKFTVNGEELLQRQSWMAKDGSTLLRKIENSKDAGKTWVLGALITLKRKS